MARCPAHDDLHASLSVGVGDDRRLLLHCFAGCKLPEVLAALDWKLGDLFGPDQIGRPNGRQIVAAYDYRDAGGELLYQVVRFAPKDFRQRRPAADKPGGWVWSLRGVQRVLYRLPELRASDAAAVVYVVEGEKDVDRLRSLGLVATCNAGGAGKWRDDYAAELRGRSVVVFADDDEPGRQHARQVARSLDGVAASLRMVALPGLPTKGDVSDWLDAGGTVERLAELIDATSEWTPADDGPAAAKRLSDIAAEPMRWLWPGRFPLGKLSLIVGDPGTGKSTLAIDLAARVSAGRPWPDAPDVVMPAGDVILLSAEDDLADTIRPRLDAAGGDPRRVLVPTDVLAIADLAAIGTTIAQARDPRLLIVDPLAAYLGATDTHKNADVRRILAPLTRLAAERGLAVVGVHHLNKAAGMAALHRAAGSLAFTAAARSVWLVAADRDDASRRLFIPAKSNVAELGNGLAYTIAADEARGMGRIEWDATPIDLSADAALGVQSSEYEDRRAALDDATDWLRELLADGPVYNDEILKLAKPLGHAQATLRRAKKLLAVESRKQGNGRGAKWYWTMPTSDGQLRLFDDP